MVTLTFARLINLALLLTIITQFTCNSIYPIFAFVGYFLLILLLYTSSIKLSFKKLTNYFESKPPGGGAIELLTTFALFYTSYILAPIGEKRRTLMSIIGMWIFIVLISLFPWDESSRIGARAFWSDPFHF